MSNQFSSPTITGYNSNAPSDDAAKTTSNQLKWAYHIEKIGDPVKNFAEALANATDSAFDSNFLNGNTAVSTTYTVAASDRGNLISCTSTFTLTLIAAATATAGFIVAIYNNGSGVITIDGNSSETVNGDATITLAANDWAILRSDGSNWLGLRGTEPLSEFQYLTGITSNVQDQLDARVTDDHDHYYDHATIAWATATAYVLGDRVQVASPDGVLYLECTTAGTSHATTEPVMPADHGGTVVDNSVTWTAKDGRGGALTESSFDLIATGSTYRIAQAGKEITASTTGYVRQGDLVIVVPRSGEYQVSFEIKTDNASNTATARFYVDPQSGSYSGEAAVGTEQATTSISYVEKTEASQSFDAGDVLVIYAKNSATNTLVRNFTLESATKLFG